MGVDAGAALVGGFSSAGLSLGAPSGGLSDELAEGVVGAVVLGAEAVAAAGEGWAAAGAALGCRQRTLGDHG